MCSSDLAQDLRRVGSHFEHDMDIVQDGVAVQQQHDIANDFSDFQRRNLEVSFSDQLAHPANDFTRSAVVLDNVPQDCKDLADVSRVGSKEPLGRSLRRGQKRAALATRALVVLRWDERARRFYVLTSYPEAER